MLLQELITTLTSPQKWDWKIATLITLLLPFLYTYLYTTYKAHLASTSAKTQHPSALKQPFTLPYTIPFLGHLFPFITQRGTFLLHAAQRYELGTPILLHLAPGISRYLITGHSMVSSFYRQTHTLSGKIDELTMLQRALGCPPASVEFWGADDSGYAPTPLPNSTVKAENRTFWINHRMVHQYLSGASLKGITERFQENLARGIEEDERFMVKEGKGEGEGEGWKEIDLYEFIQEQVMSAAIKSMFGNYLLSLNPDFIKDFWKWNGKVGALFMGIPRWLDGEAYVLREKMVGYVMKWHKFAKEHYVGRKGGEDGGDEEWEPYFGSKFARARHEQFEKWEKFDERARAASDLGILWGSNANSVVAATWFLYEILRDPTLQSNILTEFTTSLLPISSNKKTPTSLPLFDIQKLCAGPRLQSIYAETLRLRVTILTSRQIETDDFTLNGWKFEKGKYLASVSSIQAHDENVWSQGGEGNPKPLDKFWAERFLIFPGDEKSGPLKHPKIFKKTFGGDGNGEIEEKGEKGSEEPRFSMEGLSTAWTPYGGGVRMCPGRHFAKQEMISASALLLSAYEMKLVEPEREIGFDKDYYGFGAMPPKEKIRCRIRRRSAK